MSSALEFLKTLFSLESTQLVVAKLSVSILNMNEQYQKR